MMMILHDYVLYDTHTIKKYFIFLSGIWKKTL